MTVFLYINNDLYIIIIETKQGYDNMICEICNFKADGKLFSNHLRKVHKIKSKDYTREYLYNGIVGCCNCGKETRYVAYQFKKYCKDCAKIGMKEGGSRGGKAESWNKGKTKVDDSRIKSFFGKDNHFWGKKHKEETINRISFTKRLKSKDVLNRILLRNEDFEILTPLEEYFSRQRQYLKFKCKKCDFICKKTLQAFERGSLCPKCYPIGTSQSEIEIYEYLKTLSNDVEHKHRKTISPKELDIYLPSDSFSIEYNGLYWHSEAIDSTTKFDMLNKTKMCLDKQIKLMHIFSDEWHFKKDICKSMIAHRIKLSRKIYGRKCKIKEISREEFKNFMNRCHISGSVNSSIRLGLYYNDELVSAIGFRKPRQKKWKDYWEISRFACELNTSIAGGLSKMLKYFQRENNINKIMTYADRRFGEGLGYMKVGFKLYGDSGIDYWYSDGQQRFDRFTVKAQDGKSESEIASELHLYKVWGCGSNIWVLDNN